MPEVKEVTRRPVQARGAAWAAQVAAALARAGVSPNAISLTGVACAAAGCVAMVASPSAGPGARAALYLAAALTIGARSLCNLFDGMVAVEHGRKTPSGVIFNELPDRVSDVLMLAGAGYAIPSVPFGTALGWFAAVVAVTTAYVRMLGGAAGTRQPFHGPMAKPRRMAIMAAGLVLAAALSATAHRETVLAGVLALVAVGSVATVARRTLAIARELESR